MTAIRPDLGEAVGFPMLFVGYVVSAALFVRGSMHHAGRERLAWRLIGIAMVLGALGLLTFAVAIGVGYELPAFGYLDLFFVGAYVTNLAGMWVLPHFAGVPIRRLRIFLDGLVGAISVGFVAWFWFLGDLLQSLRDAPLNQVVIGSSYPLIDVATLIVVVMVTLRRSTLRFDPRVLLMGVGFIAQAVADLIYLGQGAGASFRQTDPVYPLFLLAVMGFLMAGMHLRSNPPAREYAERRTPWWAMVAPYGAALALVGMLLVRIMNARLDVETIEIFVGVVVVVGLIIIRQALAIRENRELVERQRTALVSSISHELRTPLTAMVGFLDILTDPDQHMDSDSRAEMMGIVDQQAKYMGRIVSDLVMLNRADPDLNLQFEVVPVSSVVSSAISSLDLDSAPGVTVDLDPDLTGYFDPNRAQQVLVNLLTNAARYGGPKRMIVGKQIGSDVVIEVHDNGEGVPKRYELAIWDRFERGVHRYNAGVPGSGIGLAIVSMLVRGHGGDVGYRRSEILGGACFGVTLPGAPQRVGAPRRPKHAHGMATS